MKSKKTKKSKKLLVILSILIILFAQCGIINFLNSSKVFAVDVNTTKWNQYFYDQLQPNAKAIYDAMLQMYKDGTFIKGESLEITDRVSPSSIALFVNGSNDLLNDYGAARDAFQYDYPDCFFVDWDQLSIRVTQDKSGTLHAFLGAGRSDTYLLKGMNADRPSAENGGYGEGIEGAIKEYEALITKVVKDIEKNASDINDETEKIVKMAGDAHDYVVNNMSYKHEWETRPKDGTLKMKSSARTAYDGLKYGEGVCEAYTRTFKAICDRLGIPCVCVYGIYSPKATINEPHIWNYVQIDGKWYGVDTTHDDPTKMGGLFDVYDSHENRDYFLVGKSQLLGTRYPQGIVSSANYEFKYPELEEDAYRESYLVETDDGFSVLVKNETQFDNWDSNKPIDSGNFYVSYDGLNFTQNAKLGKYIVAKYYRYNPGSDTWEESEWTYIDPWLVLFGDKDRIEEFEPSKPVNGKYCTRLELPQTKAVQFAITETPPAYLKYRIELEEKGWSQELSERLFYALNNGEAELDPNNGSLLKVSTPKIENKWGDYSAPPIPMKLTPRGNLYIGSTHHLKMEFNDKLKLKTPDSTIGIDISVNGGAGIEGNENAGHSAVANSKIENVKWDKDKTVEFDFTPSEQYADHSIFYNFQVTGLVGESSGRVPVAGTWGCVYPLACYAYAAQGYNRNVYAQPQLMESSDIDMSNWDIRDVDTHSENYGKEEKMSDFMNELSKEQGAEQDFLDSLYARLTLVTTETSPAQEHAMEEELKGAYPDELSKALQGTVNTYNISITVCKKQVLNTGESVRIALGFPKGTTYEDFAESGRLSFKAYHYKVNPETGELTGEVEEIPVTVTRQGLVLWVDSFSPFTVMAVKDDEKPVEKKELLVTSSLGGAVKENGKVLEGQNARFELTPGDSKTVNIEPEPGYEIDSIMIDGIRQKIQNKNGETLTISYDTISKGSILNVNFVAQEIHEEEAANGQSSDFEVPNISITFDKTAYDVVDGDKVTITPEVHVTGGDFNENGTGEHPDKIEYEWLKVTGGRPSPYELVQSEKDLTFDNVTVDNGGSYLFHVKPMKWNDNTNAYELMKIDGKDFSSYYKEYIKIKVYNKLEIDLKDDEKLTGDKENGYKLELHVGDEHKLTADVYRLKGEQKEEDGSEVTWTSSAPGNVFVDESGDLKVLEYTNEPVTITASVKDINGEERKVEVKVTIEEVRVSGITINGEENIDVTLEVDGNLEYNEHEGEELLIAEVYPKDTSDPEVIWTVEDESIAEIIKQTEKNRVIVKAKAVGNTIVKATDEDKVATCNVHVVETNVTGLSDELENDEIHLVVPQTGTEPVSAKIVVNVLPDNATNKELTWTSTGDVVELETSGTNKENATITPVQVGEGTITVSSVQNPSAKIVYTVYVSKDVVEVTNVSIKTEDGKTTDLAVGESLQLQAHIEPTNADVNSITWTVKEGADVVEVSESGHVHAKKEGKAVIELAVESQTKNGEVATHTAVITINVTPVKAESITIEPTELTLRSGNSEKLIATVLPLNVTEKVKWTSKNPEIASVDEEGTVTAHSKGETEIVATCGDVEATCKVTVTAVKIERLKIDKDYLKLRDKDQEGTQLVVTCEPHNAEEVKLKWESSDPEVATVSEDGIVTPVKVGTTTIKVSVDQEGYTEEDVHPVTCEVEVVPSEATLTVYAMDQDGNFLPGFTFTLTKPNDQEFEDKPVSGDGKYVFKNLTDGEYIVYTQRTPTNDQGGNEFDIHDSIVLYEFEVIDGKIFGTESESESFNEIKYSIVFKYIVGADDGLASVEIVKDENGNNELDKLYQEFVEKNKPTQPEQPAPWPDDTTPGEDNPGGDSPGEDNPGNEPENPGEDNPGNEPENPGGDNPGNGSENPGGDNPGNEPENPGGENPGNGSENPGGNNPGAAQGINPNVDSSDKNNTVSDKILPYTSDIAIGTFIVTMIVSLIGIIYIVRKKNKK